MNEVRSYYRGEIYYAHLRDLDGLVNSNEGDIEVSSTEMRKSRPVVIIQNDINNRFSSNVIVAQISSSPKKIARYKSKPSPAQMLVQLDKESLVMCDSIATISKKRLGDKIGELSSEEIICLNNALKKSLGLIWID